MSIHAKNSKSLLNFVTFAQFEDPTLISSEGHSLSLYMKRFPSSTHQSPESTARERYEG